MARGDTVRFEVRGTLQALTPIHFGGGESPGVDAVPFIDGAGRLTVPATGVVGPLRAAAAADPTWRERMPAFFGDTEQEGASRFVVHDLLLSPDTERSVREGVGIDRRSGTAADGIKFNRMVLEAGSSMDFRCAVSCNPTVADDFSAGLEELLSWLAAGQIRMGAGKSRGLGRVALQRAEHRKIQLQDLGSLLAEGPAWQPMHLSDQRVAGTARVVVAWRPATPVFSLHPMKGKGVDLFPLVATTADGSTEELRLLLPGTSIKGSLRSRAEHIVRTLTSEDAPAGDFLQQVDVPVVSDLFGSTTRRGALLVDDVMSLPIASAQGKKRLADDWVNAMSPDLESDNDAMRLPKVRKAVEKLVASVHQSHQPEFVPTAKIAIDRWTGTVADSALYSVLEPHGVQWEPLVIELEWQRLGADTTLVPAITLLLVVLDELANGCIPMGFGANRGYGSVEVLGVEVHGGPPDGIVHDALQALQQLGGRVIGGLDEELRAALTAHPPFGVSPAMEVGE